MIPAYTYLHATAAQREEPKKFCDALIASGRFWRDEHSFVRFKIGPSEYARVDSKRMLRELLLSGEFVQFDGDSDDAAFDTVWLWLAARRWSFPRLNPERPYDPPRPRPGQYTAPSLNVPANAPRRVRR